MRRKAKYVICNQPGCNVVTEGTYCEAHRPAPRVFKPRDSRDSFLDTAAWRKLSKWKLTTSPFCEVCLNNGKHIPAVDVHHIESRRSAPERALDPSNLQSLCKACHLRKTKSEIRQ